MSTDQKQPARRYRFWRLRGNAAETIVCDPGREMDERSWEPLPELDRLVELLPWLNSRKQAFEARLAREQAAATERKEPKVRRFRVNGLDAIWSWDGTKGIWERGFEGTLNAPTAYTLADAENFVRINHWEEISEQPVAPLTVEEIRVGSATDLDNEIEEAREQAAAADRPQPAEPFSERLSDMMVEKVVRKQADPRKPEPSVGSEPKKPWYTEAEVRAWLAGETEHIDPAHVSPEWMTEHLNLAFEKGKQIANGEINDLKRQLAAANEHKSAYYNQAVEGWAKCRETQRQLTAAEQDGKELAESVTHWRLKAEQAQASERAWREAAEGLVERIVAVCREYNGYLMAHNMPSLSEKFNDSITKVEALLAGSPPVAQSKGTI